MNCKCLFMKIQLAVALACAAFAVRADEHALTHHYSWGFGNDLNLIPGSTAKPEEGYDDWLNTGTAMMFKGIVKETDNGDGTWTLTFGDDVAFVDSAGIDEESYKFGSLSFNKNVKNDLVDNRVYEKYSLILFENNGVTDFEHYTGWYFLTVVESIPDMDIAAVTDYCQIIYRDPVLGNQWHYTAAPPSGAACVDSTFIRAVDPVETSAAWAVTFSVTLKDDAPPFADWWQQTAADGKFRLAIGATTNELKNAATELPVANVRAATVEGAANALTFDCEFDPGTLRYFKVKIRE